MFSPVSKSDSLSGQLPPGGNRAAPNPQGRTCSLSPLELAAEICAAYIRCVIMRSSRGRPLNAKPLSHPCQPIVAKQPPTGPGWAHALKHDGYQLQIHVRDGRVYCLMDS